MGPRLRFLTGWRELRSSSLAVAVVLATTSGVCAQEASLITPFFDGLRERGLFGAAERYGLDRRAELPVESPESVQLAVELSRTFARHAQRAADAQEQAFLQARAVEVLADYTGTEPYPRIEAAALERTYRVIDRAHDAWWNWTADPDDSAARTAAKERFAAARSALEKWIDSGTSAATKPNATRKTDDLSRRDLIVMLHAAKLKSIDLLLTSAELAETTGERDRLVRHAEESMKRLTGSSERGTTATLRGHSIRIARLTGDENQLKQLVRAATADRSQLEFRHAAIVELARFELDQGRFESAARLLVDSKSSLGEVSDQLRALHVEAVLGMAQAAGSQRSQLLASAEKEHAQVAGPWRLRNEAILQDARHRDAYGPDAAQLVRRGHREFRAGLREEAIATFREAAEAATVAAGRAELRFMTASLLVESQQFTDAISECRKVTDDSPRAELAARASLLIAYCRGRLLAKSGTDDDRRQYEEALVQHLAQYSEDTTAGDAAWMLGSLAEQGDRLALVVEADRQMPPGHARAAESTTRTVRALLRALEFLGSGERDLFDGNSASAWTADAQRVAARLLETGGNDIEAARRQLDAARVLAAIPKPDFEAVLALLNRLSQPAPQASDAESWQRLAQESAALKLVCLTATGQFADAAATLEQLGSVSRSDLLEILQKLSQSSRQLTGAPRTELARLELVTINRIRLRGAGLSPAERQLLAECEAEALYATERFADAARMFEEAVAGKPELTPRLAQALQKTGRPQDLTRARDLWQQHSSRQKQGTRLWFEAQLQLASVLVALDQSAECLKTIALTRLIYPELGGAEFKAQFDAVERQAAKK